MIGYFVKPHHRHDLAACAVIFPLFAGLSLLPPILGYGLWNLLLPRDASGWLRGLPFWLWMGWVLLQWVLLVRLVRTEPHRSNSAATFHHVQGACLAFVSVDLLMRTGGIDGRFMAIWAVCVEVAMVVFYVNYFLLALWSWTPPSWRAAAGFLFVIVSLAYEIWSSNRPPR